MSLNAPKSEQISQHHLESTQSELHKPVAKPSAESARVVRGRGAVAPQMSSRNFTETCSGKLRKTSEPRNLCQVPYLLLLLDVLCNTGVGMCGCQGIFSYGTCSKKLYKIRRFAAWVICSLSAELFKHICGIVKGIHEIVKGYLLICSRASVQSKL